MKTKHLLLKSFLLFTVVILNIQQVKSQIVGTDAFLKGNYVEIGIKGSGGYEGATAEINYYDTEEEACDVCGMYEFENAWVMKLIYNHIKKD